MKFANLRQMFLAPCLLALASPFPATRAQETDIATLAASLANFEIWLIESTPVKPEQFPEVIAEHLEYQFMLEREGIMFAAGPLIEGGDVGPGERPGLIAIRADSLEEATAIAEADPMHSSGTRTYSIRGWRINEGSINVTIKLSGQNRSEIN